MRSRLRAAASGSLALLLSVPMAASAAQAATTGVLPTAAPTASPSAVAPAPSVRPADGPPRPRATTPVQQADEQPEAPLEPAPGIPPPGANDPNCEPADEHPNPVVLVHGTFGDMTTSWQYLSPLLRDEGYCPWALDYGNRATGDIPASAQQLADFVDDVLETTDADEVDIVGHSQGGMMPRYFLKYLDGVDKVGRLIGLSPSNHGTTNPGAANAIQCPACRQQAAGSDFLVDLNSGDETFDGVDYTVIQTRFDQVVIPFSSAFLNGPSDRVTNVLLQDKCPANRAEHIGMPYDRDAVAWAVNALEQDGPADPDFNPCGSSRKPAGSGDGSGGTGNASAVPQAAAAGDLAPPATAVSGTPDFVG